jgi:hypothetical protein
MAPSARIANIILGVWLFISAFIWPHSPEQYSNTWILGALCVIFAVVAIAVPWFRYLNTALAVWLFISAFALPTVSVGTVWNNALVAIAIFIVSLLPTERGTKYVRRPTATTTQTTPPTPA